MHFTQQPAPERDGFDSPAFEPLALADWDGPRSLGPSASRGEATAQIVTLNHGHRLDAYNEWWLITSYASETPEARSPKVAARRLVQQCVEREIDDFSFYAIPFGTGTADPTLEVVSGDGAVLSPLATAHYGIVACSAVISPQGHLTLVTWSSVAGADRRISLVATSDLRDYAAGTPQEWRRVEDLFRRRSRSSASD